MPALVVWQQRACRVGLHQQFYIDRRTGAATHGESAIRIGWCVRAPARIANASVAGRRRLRSTSKKRVGPGPAHDRRGDPLALRWSAHLPEP
jgi:hypothetical protein